MKKPNRHPQGVHDPEELASGASIDWIAKADGPQLHRDDRAALPHVAPQRPPQHHLLDRVLAATRPKVDAAAEGAGQRCAGIPLSKPSGRRSKVDTKNPDRGPLLIIDGEKDHTVPWAIANAAFKRQRRNPGVTEIVKIPNRGHALTIDHGWREVAQTALDFVKRFT